jgi:hypothetical protein|tara:strand:- start:5403 stop:5999 length:597 start_codon:yes stop_codon:yes gene_type:complete
MLSLKNSLNSKILFRLLNTGVLETSGKTALFRYCFGFYYQNFILNNKLISYILIKMIRFFDCFSYKKNHILFLFGENISVYFILQFISFVLKARFKISVCQEKNWFAGQIINGDNNIFSRKFSLLMGFDSKPVFAILFGISSNYVIKEFTSSFLPVVFIQLENSNICNFSDYSVPLVNSLLLEDFILIFIIKYSFFSR